MDKHFKKTKQLSEEGLFDLCVLSEQAYQADGYRAKLYWKVIKDRKNGLFNDYVCYYDNQLIGYIGLFLFGDFSVEITAITHPNYRKQHIFNTLLQDVASELQSWNVTQCLFLCPRGAEQAESIVKRLGASYGYTEYQLEFDKSRFFNLSQKSNVQFRETKENSVLLHHIHQCCFGGDEVVSEEHLNRIMARSNQHTWIVELEGEPIGKIHLHTDYDNHAYIHDICIIPEYQKRGYAVESVRYVLSHVDNQEKGAITMDVETSNLSVIQKYESIGFKVKTVNDYWVLELCESPTRINSM